MEQAASKAVAAYAAAQNQQPSKDQEKTTEPADPTLETSMAQLLTQMHMQWLDSNYEDEYQKND
jgi:inorganic triphosphatase YgiF